MDLGYCDYYRGPFANEVIQKCPLQGEEEWKCDVYAAKFNPGAVVMDKTFFQRASSQIDRFVDRNAIVTPEYCARYHGEIYGGKHNMSHALFPELIAGAAAFEAIRVYDYRHTNNQIPQSEDQAQEIIVGMAMAEAIRLFDKHGCFSGREVLAAQAGAAARALFNRHREQLLGSHKAPYLMGEPSLAATETQYCKGSIFH